MSEATDHQALFAYLATIEPRYPLLAYAFHPANGEKRDKATAARLKRMGVRRGTPDVLFPHPHYDAATNTNYAGLAIELKTATGRVRPEQEAWLAHLRRGGWFCAVCREWTDAARLLIKWVGGDPTQEGL